mmetsp:Transcript_8449/g.26407  ORF Transcript_8449/g.26407 Transcript_8449/m.26407 type:complete len:373 (+) Transcript_8449:825-1943(+)
MPRSMTVASSCARHKPARSPQRIDFTAFRNICIDLTFFSRPSSGSSTTSFARHAPRSAVPVTTVPWPRIGKQWSMAKKNGPASSRSGTRARRRNISTRSSSPRLWFTTGSARRFDALSSALTAATFSPPTHAAHATTGASRNFEVASCALRRFVALAMASARSASGNMSTLLKQTIKSSVVISPITRHSAVCVCMPLTTSTTNTMRSMICAPPMMVRMSDAWPGQSTSVNWSSSASNAGPGLTWSGSGTLNDEKPRSSVMPRAFDSGALSSDAVESVVDSAFTTDVLPLSTWPITPTLRLSGKTGSGLSFFFGGGAAAAMASRGRRSAIRACARARAVRSLALGWSCRGRGECLRSAAAQLCAQREQASKTL